MKVGLRARRALRLFGAVLAGAAMSGSASASPTILDWGQISFIGFGWNAGDTRVTLGGTVQNPDNCSFPDAYMVEGSAAWAQVFSSALLTAYSLGHPVRVVIEGCTGAGRPKIIGVDLQRS